VSLILESLAFLLGGLGVFLLGMRFMSDGLQTVAGPSLKNLIGAVTNNRFLGVLVGLVVTCLVQSSAITTVMAIGFVNAEMMLLKQAIGVIMGANVGTTITGWVLVLDIGKYGLPLAGICALFFCFAKNERLRYTMYAILGVGLVFIGLETMKDALEPLATSEKFRSVFAMFSADTFPGIIKCVVVGCLLTALVQSSSATLGVTIALAYQGLICFETSAALILGQNIGSTITAFIASIGTSKAARRVALFHIIFNVLGVLWVVLLFRPYLHFIQFSLEHFLNIAPSAVTPRIEYSKENITTAIATFHTAFNVVNLFVFLPFTGYIAKILEKCFNRHAPQKKLVATKLENQLLSSPFAAITHSSREILGMGERVNVMLDDLAECLKNGPESKKRKEAVFAGEAHLDSAQEEVTNFLTRLLSGRASQSIANDAERQLRMSDDLETASDYIAQILKLHLRLQDNNLQFDEEHSQGLLSLHEKNKALIELVLQQINNPRDFQQLEAIQQAGFEITQLVRSLRSMHWSRLAEEQYEPLISTTYTDMLSSYRKIKEHLVQVAETISLPSA
jgi:phosphate:Na+ symporter